MATVPNIEPVMRERNSRTNMQGGVEQEEGGGGTCNLDALKGKSVNASASTPTEAAMLWQRRFVRVKVNTEQRAGKDQ